MKRDSNKITFMKITNEDIYIEIQDLKTTFNGLKSKIKINAWLGATALSLALASITTIALAF
jgi:hypothetical protein